MHSIYPLRVCDVTWDVKIQGLNTHKKADSFHKKRKSEAVGPWPVTSLGSVHTRTHPHARTHTYIERNLLLGSFCPLIETLPASAPLTTPQSFEVKRLLLSEALCRNTPFTDSRRFISSTLWAKGVDKLVCNMWASDIRMKWKHSVLWSKWVTQACHSSHFSVLKMISVLSVLTMSYQYCGKE